MSPTNAFDDTFPELSGLSARERILVTAHGLFYSQGVRATGIDSIIAASGVAKLTFYRHFSAKDVLVRAFLDYRHDHWMAWFVDALGRHGARDGCGFVPLVKVVEEWFLQPAFRGCAFINVVSELGGSQPGVLAIAQRHKNDMLEVITALLPSIQGNQAIASAAALAVDGAIVRAQMEAQDSKTLESNMKGQKKSALDGLRQVLMALECMSGRRPPA